MKSHKVPLMDREVLLDEGSHFTIRRQLTSTKKIVHVPVKDFDVDDFDDHYLPVRASSNYRKRVNKIGFIWLATTGRLVPFESTLERTILLDLDYNPDVARIWTQPFRVDGIDPNRGDEYVRPYPDVLVEYTNKRLEVIDVKPQRRMQPPILADFDDDVKKFGRAVKRFDRMNENFAYLKAQIEAFGWDYRIQHELTDVRRNLSLIHI